MIVGNASGENARALGDRRGELADDTAFSSACSGAEY
jgi:hypothetical protein